MEAGGAGGGLAEDFDDARHGVASGDEDGEDEGDEESDEEGDDGLAPTPAQRQRTQSSEHEEQDDMEEGETGGDQRRPGLTEDDEGDLPEDALGEDGDEDDGRPSRRRFATMSQERMSVLLME